MMLNKATLVRFLCLTLSNQPKVRKTPSDTERKGGMCLVFDVSV
jgi:hypothetical protein